MEDRIKRYLDRKKNKSTEEYILLTKLACGTPISSITEYCPDLIPVLKEALKAVADK